MPVVYHPLYSAPQLAAGHRFPMQVFGRIHDRLLQQGIIQPSQVGACQLILQQCRPCSDHCCSILHSPDVIQAVEL
jgi:hypothetical protein